MPRFFFDFRQGKTELRDDEGQDLSDGTEAEQHARQVAYELARNKPNSETRGCFVVVRDADGAQVAQVALSDAN
jgi:hypothetical protein